MAPFPATLVAVAGLLRDARDPWWLIGSAAVALHGVAGYPPADVDVLLSLADAKRLRPLLVAAEVSADSAARFRSAVFGSWPGAPLPVELMADLHVREADNWRPVALATREPFAVANATVWIPERDELIALLHRFGRPKDMARAAALTSLGRASLTR